MGNSTACTQPILISPPLLTFPQQLLGSAPSSQTFTLTNNSAATLSGLTITLDPLPGTSIGISPFNQLSDFDGLPNFTEQDNCSSSPGAPFNAGAPFSLTAQQSCNITISFEPQQSCSWIPYNGGNPNSQEGVTPLLCPYSLSALLTVTDPQNGQNQNDPDTAFNVPITGSAASDLVPVAGELDYGWEGPAESSSPQTVTFTNQGTQPVEVLPTIPNQPCGGTIDQNGFTLQRPLTSSSGVSDFQIVRGNISDGLTLPPPSPVGNGVDNIIYYCDADLTSNGTPSFQLSDDTCGGQTIQPGASCSVNVTFAPQAKALKAAVSLDYFLELNTLQCSSSVTADCEIDSGRFPLEIKSNPPSPLRMTPAAGLWFGVQTKGQTTAPLTVTLFNDPNDPNSQTVTFTGNKITGDYLESDNCGASLAPGASCTLNFTFTPKVVGYDAGTFAIIYPVGLSETVTETIYLRGAGQ